MQGGYSTTIEINSNFIKTTQIMARVRSALKEKLSITSSTTHKETTPGAKVRLGRLYLVLLASLPSGLMPFGLGMPPPENWHNH